MSQGEPQGGGVSQGVSVQKGVVSQGKSKGILQEELWGSTQGEAKGGLQGMSHVSPQFSSQSASQDGPQGVSQRRSKGVTEGVGVPKGEVFQEDMNVEEAVYFGGPRPPPGIFICFILKICFIFKIIYLIIIYFLISFISSS